MSFNYNSRCILTIVSIISLLDLLTALDDIDCTEQNQCLGHNITCNEQEDCRITCGLYGCKQSLIYCPLNGDCTILCQGSESCMDSIIYANASNSNFNLLCKSDYIDGDGYSHKDECKNIKVYGNTVNTDTAINNTDKQFNILCGMERRSCLNAEFICSQSMDCSLQCNATTSCKSATIKGPKNKQLTVECGGATGCNGITVDGQYASNVSVICDILSDDACFDLTLYCPLQRNLTKICYLEGGNNLRFGTNEQGTRIYAKLGWDDININYKGDVDVDFGGTMYCGNNYNMSCPLINNVWNCDNQQCYGPLITYDPTIDPTPSPTNIPTSTPTNVPTPSPTDNPTPSPTDNPTPAPTNNPTPSLTDNPTINPTPSPTDGPTASSDPTKSPTDLSMNPTLIPSNHPSIDPTISPTKPPSTPKPTIQNVGIFTPTLSPTNKDGRADEDDRTTTEVAVGGLIDDTEENTDSIIMYIGIGCGIFGCLICCILVCVLCRYRKNKTTKDDKKPVGRPGTLEAMQIVPSNSQHTINLSYKRVISGSSPIRTSPSSDEYIGSYEHALDGIPEEADDSLPPGPMRQNSDDLVCDGDMNITVALTGDDVYDNEYKNDEFEMPPQHKISLAPSHISEIQMVESVQFDEEIIGSDDEPSIDGGNIYKFKTPTGNKVEHDDVYIDRLGAIHFDNTDDEKEEEHHHQIINDDKPLNNKINNDNNKLKLAKEQSEGGEQYHKLPNLMDRPSNKDKKEKDKLSMIEINVNGDAALMEEDEEEEEEEEDVETPNPDNNVNDDDDMMTPIGGDTPNGDELSEMLQFPKFEKNIKNMDAINENEMDENEMDENEIDDNHDDDDNVLLEMRQTPKLVAVNDQNIAAKIDDDKMDLNALNLNVINIDKNSDLLSEVIGSDEIIIGDDEIEDMVKTPKSNNILMADYGDINDEADNGDIKDDDNDSDDEVVTEINKHQRMFTPKGGLPNIHDILNDDD